MKYGKNVLSRLRTALSGNVAGLSTYTTFGRPSGSRQNAMARSRSTMRSWTQHWRITTTPRRRCLSPNRHPAALRTRWSGRRFSRCRRHRCFTIRKTAITSQISKLTDEIGRKEDIASQYEERLRLPNSPHLIQHYNNFKSQTNALKALQ